VGGLDRKAIAVIALCVLFLVFYRPILKVMGWDRYLPSGNPVATQTAGRGTSKAPLPSTGANRSEPASPSAPSSESLSFRAASPGVAPAIERTYLLETPLYRATFSSRGARLISVEMLRYASAHGASSKNGRAVHVPAGQIVPPDDRVVLAGGPLLGLDLGSGDTRRDLSDVVYTVRDSLDAHGQNAALTFEARDTLGATVRQTYRVRPDNYAIDLEVEIRNVPQQWRISDYSLTARSWAPINESDILADTRSMRATSMVGTNIHRDAAIRLVDHPRVFDGNARWAAVQSRYFVAGVAVGSGPGRGVEARGLRRPLTPAERAILSTTSSTRTEADIASNTLEVGLPSDLSPVQRFVLYVGPSEYFRLASLHVGLERVVDLGWTWVQPASRAMLHLLKWFYAVVRNYGFAIILLATLVRLLLHPLNVMSIRSMRAMQRIQPELERIREKYKNDAQGLNTAMMALYKENKVNPAGGCLPMVIQIPVFIALYNVLFNAIELRQAPFIAWIHDLSAPDLLFMVGPVPIRLLPILMLGSGILSQRLTPTDPRQLPTMYLMNAFMLVFFYNLPSGLVLYWTLMNLLTALQQWSVLYHDSRSAPVVVTTEPAPKTRRKSASRSA